MDQSFQETNEINENIIILDQTSAEIKTEVPNDDQTIDDSIDDTFIQQKYNLRNNKKRKAIQLKVIEDNVFDNGKSDTKDSHSGDNCDEETESHSIDFKCDKLFDSNSELKDHYSEHPNQSGQTSNTSRKFVCLYSGCHKSYVNSNDLKIHIMAKHTNRRPFKCEECIKTFVTKSHLKSHQKTHSKRRKFHYKLKRGGDRNIRCEYTDCDTYFKNKTALAIHTKRYHTTVKQFECNECLRKFLTELQLKEHQKILHSKQEVFQC